MESARRLRSDAPRAGGRMGKYRLDAVIGHGGMGVVYRGTHLDSGESVALKTVIAADARRLSQIRSEVQALTRLAHPGLVRVLDQGVYEGRPWYAMDLVQGRTLRDLTRELFEVGPPPRSTSTAATMATAETAWETTESNEVSLNGGVARRPHLDTKVEAGGRRLAETLGVVMQLCETLEYVHGESIVHRDVKPSNIFVTPDGRPVLVDFGLAAHGGGAGGREVLEAAARFGGSVRYMAPEQIRGELLDPRCDLYALGCVLFELVTGRPPFDGGVRQILEQHEHRVAPPMSAFANDVPPALERVVARLLAKERAARIGYASDVKLALANCSAQSPGWDVTPPRPRMYLYRPPMVGRDEILGQLERALRRSLRRHGQAVFVEGESGVGKTRFALEVAQHVGTRGVKVIAGGCTSMSAETAVVPGLGVCGGPLHPLQPLLRTVADACTEGGPNEAARLLGTAGALLADFEPALRHVVGSTPARAPLPMAAARLQLYRALAATLRALTSVDPLLLILDDLQWSDELTLGFLRHLIANGLEQMPLLVLGLVRREERGPELSALLCLEGVQHLSLQRLASNKVGEMVAGMLAMRAAPQELIEFLNRYSDGNPFFVAEYLRIAIERGMLVRDESGQWQAAARARTADVLSDAFPLPGSLRELIEGRLNGLPTATRALVRLAAVAGRELELDLLAVAGNATEEQVLEAVTDLRAHQIVELADKGNLRFAHDKLRETLYSELAENDRRALHRSLAQALETRNDLVPEAQHGPVGLHWFEAAEPDRAIPYLRAAGDAAAKMHALEQAIAFYGSALHACELAGEQAAGVATDIGEKLADALALTGGSDQARSALEKTLAICPERDCVRRARLHRKHGKTWEAVHDHAEELLAYERSEHELKRDHGGDPAGWWSEWIQVQLNRTWVFYWQARVDDMNATLATLTPYLDEHASALQRSSYYQAVVTRDYRQQRFVVAAETLDFARKSLAAAEEARAPLETAFARFVLGFGLLFAERLQEAERELLGALAETRRLGDNTNAIRCLAYLLLIHRRAHRSAQAQLLAEETLARATAAQMLDYVGLAQACQGWLAWRQNRNEDAARLSRAALESWAKLSFCYPFQWTAVLTSLAVGLGTEQPSALIELVRILLGGHFSRLPDAIDARLQAAVAAHDAGDAPRAQTQLRHAVVAATALKYL